MRNHCFNRMIVLAGLIFACFASLLAAQEAEDYKILRDIIINEFKNEVPESRGTDLPGVLHQFETKEKKVALILGACLDQGAEIDLTILKNLKQHSVSASLFTDQAWLKKNSKALGSFMDSGTVTLENHGLYCRPVAVDGRGVKGMAGTSSIEEAFEEIEQNARIIENISGRLPRFFKSGAAYYDDVTLKIVKVLGYVPIDGDLKLRAKDVETDAALDEFLNRLKPGAVIVLPVNRPGQSTAWIEKFLNGVSQRGYQFEPLDNMIDAANEPL